MNWKYKEKLRIKGKLVVGLFFASLVLNYRLSEHVHAHYLDGKSYDIMTLSYMKKTLIIFELNQMKNMNSSLDLMNCIHVILYRKSDSFKSS